MVVRIATRSVSLCDRGLLREWLLVSGRARRMNIRCLPASISVAMSPLELDPLELESPDQTAFGSVGT